MSIEMDSTYDKDFRLFEALFNREGYILDFTNSSFAAFTLNSIGISIQEKYGESKGRSLSSFLHDSNIASRDKWKLLNDLFGYYEEKYEIEYIPGMSDEDYIPDINAYGIKFNSGMSRLHSKCKEVLDKVNGLYASNKVAEQLKTVAFSNQYLRDEVDIMVNEVLDNPTDAIGKAKELVESCCKTILDESGMSRDKKWDIPKLADETMKLLKLMPKDISDTDKGTDIIKAIYGNLRGIVSKLAELRNMYGSGHGKDDNFRCLDTRHARLAVNCSIAFCEFVWDTWEDMKAYNSND